MVAIDKMKIYFPPGIRKRDKPYATAIDEQSTPMPPTNSIKSVLPKRADI